MNKKCGLFYWFSLYLFIMSPQEMRAAGIHSGYVVITQPVIAGLGMAATALTTIAQNAYQKYLENSKKEDEQYCCYTQRKEELKKIKQELIRIRDDLRTIKGLDLESFTYQFLKYYSNEQFNGLSLPFIDQEKCLSEYELMLLEKQMSDICSVLISHLNQLVENVNWIDALYNNWMVEVNRAIEIWSRSYVIAPEDAFKIYGHYLVREYLITRMQGVFDEILIVSHYYRTCKNEHIKSAITALTTLQQIVSVVEGKKSWVLEQKSLARNNSAIIEGYFADRNISVVTFKNATQKDFGEEFKKRDAEILKKAIIEQQANSGFGGGPKKDDDEEDELEDSSSMVKISKDDAPHMFGNRSGHLVDTPANRKLLIDLASKKENFLGIDSYGTAWYGEILKNGKQLWATVRNNLIRNGGINDVLREFNPKTGLSSLTRSFK